MPGSGLNTISGAVDILPRDGRQNKKSKWDKVFCCFCCNENYLWGRLVIDCIRLLTVNALISGRW